MTLEEQYEGVDRGIKAEVTGFSEWLKARIKLMKCCCNCKHNGSKCICFKCDNKKNWELKA